MRAFFSTSTGRTPNHRKEKRMNMQNVKNDNQYWKNEKKKKKSTVLIAYLK